MGTLAKVRPKSDSACPSVSEINQVEAGIDDIVFAQRPQIVLPLDVKPLDLIEDIGLQQRVDIGGDRLHRRFCLSAIVQQSLTDKGAPDGRRRGVVADVVSQKQDDLAKQQCVGHSPLFFSLAAFQNVPHDNSGINTIQQHISSLLIQLCLGQRRHPAKLCIGFKQVTQLIRFAAFPLSALFRAAVGRFVLFQQVAVEVQKFPE